ncbi:MAG: type II secretion system F family protein [Eubacterium sp.]|nr:type II secretion system F family protein [Eubacterium sp.]
MTGSIVSIIFFTVSFALLTFALAYITASTVLANKIATEKRIEELNKSQGDADELALVKSESKSSRRKREKKRENRAIDERIGSLIYAQLQAADVKMRPEEFLLIWVLIAFVPGGLVALFMQNAVVTMALIIAGLVLPIAYLKMKQKSRIKKFEDQLSDALMICCSCLRSGLSFTQAMETIAHDMDAPISTEFDLTLKEMNMGYSMDDALENLGKRMKSRFVDLMVSAVLVQRQTGGNLSKILENISDTIKEKMKLKKQLKTATASGRTSGMIVGLMPVALLGMFSAVNYEFVSVLFEETRGHILLAVAAGLELLAFVAVKKIISVKM